ncbi:pentatricopeptide repeat-containing protein At5g55740, chloroplastic [Morus notabilis]|uniref:pentatricopeptide repeat-containing protein At5g55740, chloroplastic n=1 Tax=Morus notabilis TaxID=981085 RepID=UPI000CED7B25|nr:pentatricopeptide repeat-containing protein At5g55740, chloroplastic [Morus notabilis]
MASLPFTSTAKPHLLPLSKLSKPTESQKITQTHFTKHQEDAKSHPIFFNNSYFRQISSLCKQGQVPEAVDLFTEMGLRNLRIEPEIYGELLQGCVYERDLSTGRQIHARIVKSGEFVARNEYIETKLVIFYAKCDVYSVASRMFRMVSEKNVFSWAAIIGLNCRMGFCEEALLGFLEMLEFGFLPDNFVVPNALKACGALQLVGLGKGIQGYVLKMGFGECVFVASSLVDMYGKCGALDCARKMFDRMPERNVVTWNSLIVGYVQNGMNEEAIKVFYDMRMEGVEPTQVTMSGFLAASANIGALEEGKQGHGLAVVEGLVLNTILGSSIINFYSKVGLMEDAELVFSSMVEKDVVTWNLIISGYVQFGKVEQAIGVCRQMRTENLRFDSVTLASFMSASADTADLKLGKEGHCYCIRNDLNSDVVVASSIVNMYAKCKRIDCARQVFDSITKGDLVLWNTMLAAYAELGHSGEALKLFYQMQLESVPPNLISWNSVILGFLKNGQVNEAKDMFLQMQSVGVQPNLVTWTSLVSGLAENGFGCEAIFAFQQMQEAGIRPNVVSIVSVLSACIDMTLLQCGKAVHGYSIRHALVLSIPLATSLVDMYAKCGNIDQAKKVFDITNEKELPIYNAMISGYALHGQAMDALALYSSLEEVGTEPDSITFTNALYACSHSGLVNEGLELFVEMVSKHNIKPSMVHYGCMVNLLSRCGNLDEAFRLITSMPYEPDAHIFGSLLAACRENNNIELAEYLSKKLMELEPNNSGNYVALSNAYAAAGKWDEVENVRYLMKGKGLMKIPGCSWIQIGEESHVFVAGDKSHPKLEEINWTLSLLRWEIWSLELNYSL